jgi:hypothetical protein
MRRRLDLERLSDQIIVVLHQQFFDDSVGYLSFQQIRETLEDAPSNAVRMELEELVGTRRVNQKTVQRTRTGGLFAITGQTPPVYDEPVDGFRITKSGIQYVERMDDERYSSIEKELGLGGEVSEAVSTDDTAWEPIPLDRADELQQKAIKALDQTIEELRGSNGYNVVNSDEKVFVHDKLAAVAKRLKDDSQISWMYLQEFAIKPLGIIIKRFGGAAIGIAAVAAKEALSTWLKSKGISLLDSFIK